NTGIGFETAKSLATKGYNVTIGCRDAQKAEAALARIRADVPWAAPLDAVALDLSDLASVRDCAKRVLDSGVQYDVWLNNAGVMACPKMATAQGFEYQLGVNHLGHFALTTAVLPGLQASEKPVRIVTVASAAHTFGKVNFEDLQRDKSYEPWEAYGQSKLANILFSYELARRLGPNSLITANCLHPGVVKTELGRYMIADGEKNWYMPLALEAFKFFMLEPEQGAATSIFCTTSPEMEGVTGKYYTDSRRATSSSDSYSRDAAQRLWAVSEELTAAKAAPVAAAV
ncbi:Retinol dehydrogenase 12, partial [Tetrabaena socialis]